MALIHASDYDPLIFPIVGDADPGQIDRAQSIDPTISLNRTEVNEIGRTDGLVGYVKGTPVIGYKMNQLEYGSIDFWRKITCKGNAVNTLTLDDFKTPYFDLAAYLTDDDGTAVGTMVYPALRTSGFSMSIGAPNAIIERSFDLVGEEAKIWQGNNKYYIYYKHTAGSGDDNEINLSTREPVANPDVGVGLTDEEKYIIRVVRVRAGVTTTLTVTTDYTYSNSTKILSLVDVDTADIIKVYYTSSTAPSLIWTANDIDPVALKADSASIYLYVPGSGKPSSTDYLYKLQSITMDVTFERQDLKEIGNKLVVQRGISDKNVSFKLGRLMERFTIEEALRGVGADYGLIDVEQFTDNASVIIKIFSDSTKSTLKYGFKSDGLSPTDVNNSIAVKSYGNQENSIAGKSLTISNQNSELGSL